MRITLRSIGVCIVGSLCALASSSESFANFGFTAIYFAGTCKKVAGSSQLACVAPTTSNVATCFTYSNASDCTKDIAGFLNDNAECILPDDLGEPCEAGRYVVNDFCDASSVPAGQAAASFPELARVSIPGSQPPQTRPNPVQGSSCSLQQTCYSLKSIGEACPTNFTAHSCTATIKLGITPSTTSTSFYCSFGGDTQCFPKNTQFNGGSAGAGSVTYRCQ